MPFYLIVRGPLGAGKTTVATALAKAIPGRVISIDDILETLLWDGGSEALFLEANKVAAAQAHDAFQHVRAVVVDGNFYWQSAIDDLARCIGVPHEVFTLKVPLEVCIARDRGRPLSYGEEATREVFEKVARVESGLSIDGTQDVATIVREVRSRLGASWFAD